MEEGSELLANGGALAERVTGAERQMEPLFHEHLAEVLLGHACRRLDFWEFVTVMNKSEWLDGEYVKDVADVLLWQYSDNP